MNRPMGVTILAWLAIIGGAFALFGSIALVIASVAGLAITGAAATGAAVAGAGAAVAGAAFWTIVALVMGIWLAVLGAFEIVFGVGALGLKPWAWTVGVLWCYVAAASDVLSVFTSRGGGIFGAIIGILFAVAILYYLYTDEVRAAFGKSDKAAPAFITPVFMWINDMLANRGGRPQAPGGYPQGPSGGSGPGSYQPPTPAHFEEQPPAPPAPPMQ